MISLIPMQHGLSGTAGILRERLGTHRIGGCWTLRLPPGTGFWRQARRARIPRRLTALIGAHTAQYSLWLLSWWLIGRSALQGYSIPTKKLVVSDQVVTWAG